jgi:hypothetical protein
VGQVTFRNFAHDGIRHVSVENFGSGSISIAPGPEDNAVEGSLNAADEDFLAAIEVRQDGDKLRIDMPRRLFFSSSVHLRMGVPAGLTYSIASGSADITISAPIARSKIVSGSGDITIAEAEDLNCSTGSGDVGLGRLVGSGARMNTGSGDIIVSAAHCPVSAKSGSGTVVIRSLHESALQASSGSGDIAIPSTTGSVDLRSASGSLTVGVADDLPAWLDLNSVSGQIRITLEASGEPGPDEPYVSVRARTASGEIAVYRA